MLFNSSTFVVFLAIVLPVYYMLRHRMQNWLLLVASYVFYGWWDYRFLVLLLLSTVIDFWAAIHIEQSPTLSRRRWFLAISMLFNMGCLCFFKYFNFFTDATVKLLGVLGFQADAPTLQILLPVGISFYTFQTMSYTIDVYRAECKASRNLVEFAVSVAFFPHLVAGPIQRAANLLPLVENDRKFSAENSAVGLWLILVGYVKKCVIADRLADLVDAGFTAGGPPLHGAQDWLLLYAFAFQIYGDFSGYSDIARGLSKIMGFELMVNFKAPYLVTNPSDFWRNWHISLSTWLRDYLYIPLGGSRYSPARTYANLFTTMLLGGLWHGAGWAYLAWGVYQGALLIVHRLLKPVIDRIGGVGTRALGAPVWHGLLVIGFFHLTCLGWLIFRIGSLPPEVDQGGFIIASLRGLCAPPIWSGTAPLIRALVPLAALGLVLQWKEPNFEQFDGWPTWAQSTAVAAGVLAITAIGVFNGTQFIYFQF